jgi:FKBP-type peptidyl-prolyl cis-trans isomerase 2
VGTQLVAEDPNGSRRPVRIHEVRAEEIVIDLNHPLAGQTLHFEVRILAVG